MADPPGSYLLSYPDLLFFRLRVAPLHQIGGESEVQIALPPSGPLAALFLNTAASSVSSGHTLSVRGRQLVATATSIAVEDLGLALTLTG